MSLVDRVEEALRRRRAYVRDARDYARRLVEDARRISQKIIEYCNKTIWCRAEAVEDPEAIAEGLAVVVTPLRKREGFIYTLMAELNKLVRSHKNEEHTMLKDGKILVYVEPLVNYDEFEEGEDWSWAGGGWEDEEDW